MEIAACLAAHNAKRAHHLPSARVASSPMATTCNTLPTQPAPPATFTMAALLMEAPAHLAAPDAKYAHPPRYALSASR